MRRARVVALFLGGGSSVVATLVVSRYAVPVAKWILLQLLRCPYIC